MAASASSCFFTFPNFSLNSQPSSSSLASSSVRYGKARISAAYATAERTATASVSSLRIGGPSSLYDVLGIQIGADMREVKTAYRRLARILHPDVGNGGSSADEFMRVHSAYATLSDPEKRADYDRTIFRRQKWAASAAVTMASTARSSSRKWETDQCW